jgi:hypothetical protein
MAWSLLRPAALCCAVLAFERNERSHRRPGSSPCEYLEYSIPRPPPLLPARRRQELLQLPLDRSSRRRPVWFVRTSLAPMTRGGPLAARRGRVRVALLVCVCLLVVLTLLRFG